MKLLARRSTAIRKGLLALLGVAIAAAGALHVDAAPSMAAKRVSPFSPRAKTKRVNVVAVSDASRRAQATLGPEGGSLKATGRDGARYTLKIPRGAVPGGTTITMEPLTKVGRLPLKGGLIGGVQFGPEGLTLLEPARLTIVPKRKYSARRAVAFGYHESGADFHLEPFARKTKALAVDVAHFSGVGTAEASPKDIASQQSKLPVRAEDRLAQEAQEALQGERACQLGGSCKGKGNTEKRLAQLVYDYYDQVVKPALQGAETSSGRYRAAKAQYFGWSRQAQLLGLGDEPDFKRRSAQGLASLLIAFKNFYREQYRFCRDDHDLRYAVDLVALAREAALEFGQGEAGQEVAEIIELANKCATVEVRFETVYASDPPGEGESFFHLRSTVKLVLLTAQEPIGGGPIEWVEGRFSNRYIEPSCGPDEQLGTRGDLLRVLGGRLALNPGSGRLESGFNLSVDPGNPVVRHRTCASTGSEEREASWVQEFRQTYGEGPCASEDPATGECTARPSPITDWETPLSGAVFALKTAERERTEEGFDDRTGAPTGPYTSRYRDTWEIVHAPE